MQVTLNKRTYEIKNKETVEGALADDLVKRGWEAVFYTLVGKRGATKLCLRSNSTGKFSELL